MSTGTAKMSAQKTELQLEIGSVYTKVVYVSDISGPDADGQFWDATDLDSDFIEDGEPLNLLAPGTCTAEVFYVPKNTTHQAILARKYAQTKSNWKVVYPDGSEVPFVGTPKKFTPKAAKAAGLTASLEIKLASLPAFPGVDDGD